MADDVINVLSVLVGDLPEEYPQQLAKGLALHLHAPHRLYCLTERHRFKSLAKHAEKLAYSNGVAATDVTINGVTWLPLLHDFPRWYSKVEMWRPSLESLGRILYIDVTSVIVGDLKEIALYDGPACVTNDFYHGTQENPVPSQSILNYEAGWGREIYDAFVADPDHWIALGNKMVPPDFRDQVLMKIKAPTDFWPADKVVSWKVHCQKGIPDNARIVKFHGEPKPHETEWARKIWEGGKIEITRGVTGSGGDPVPPETIERNIKHSMSLGLQQFVQQTPHNGKMIICGSAPSLALDLKWLKKKSRTQPILACNGALTYLMKHGVKPWGQVVMDPMPRVVRHIEYIPGTKYLFASQCDPSAFEKVPHEDIILWHMHSPISMNIMNNQGGMAMTLGGGCTVGTRAINIAHYLGFSDITLCGIDSCYTGAVDHVHQEDEKRTFTLTCSGRDFLVNDAWAKQALDFKEMMNMHAYGNVSVRGNGLLAWMVSSSKEA